LKIYGIKQAPKPATTGLFGLRIRGPDRQWDRGGGAPRIQEYLPDNSYTAPDCPFFRENDSVSSKTSSSRVSCPGHSAFRKTAGFRRKKRIFTPEQDDRIWHGNYLIFFKILIISLMSKQVRSGRDFSGNFLENLISLPGDPASFPKTPGLTSPGPFLCDPPGQVAQNRDPGTPGNPALHRVPVAEICRNAKERDLGRCTAPMQDAAKVVMTGNTVPGVMGVCNEPVQVLIRSPADGLTDAGTGPVPLQPHAEPVLHEVPDSRKAGHIHGQFPVAGPVLTVEGELPALFRIRIFLGKVRVHDNKRMIEEVGSCCGTQECPGGSDDPAGTGY